jgi:hypothetical protein
MVWFAKWFCVTANYSRLQCTDHNRTKTIVFGHGTYWAAWYQLPTVDAFLLPASWRRRLATVSQQLPINLPSKDRFLMTAGLRYISSVGRAQKMPS